MFSDFRIYIAIGIFMIVCVSLMIFNFVIVYYNQDKSTPSAVKVEKWKDILYKQTIASAKRHNILKHDKFLLRKLTNVENLIVYSKALQYLKSEFPEAYSDYIHKRYTTFQKLASTYSRKPVIERTCYANFIGEFPEAAGGMYGQLAGTLISFIDDFSVHCRTNVLSALCSIGSIEGVINALQVINDKSLFMHNQLLTNVLLSFKGDKEALGAYLWDESQHWSDSIAVSVIQFITGFSGRYNETFLPVLEDVSVSTTVRTAIIRYYGQHIYMPARQVLVELIANPTDTNLAMEAASVLSLYPVPSLPEAAQNESNYLREMATYMLKLEDVLRNNGLKKKMDGEKVSA